MTEHNDDCPHCGEDISEVVQGLKSVVEKTREEKRNYKTREKVAQQKLQDAVTELEALKKTADPEKFEALQTEINELKATTVSKADYDSMKTELDAQTATATKLQDEATSGKVATAVAKAGGNLAMLSPMIKATLAANPKLDIDAHIATLKNDADFGGAFKASEHSGGGSDAGAGRSSITTKTTETANLRRSTMTDAEKNAFQKDKGLDALLDLPL